MNYTKLNIKKKIAGVVVLSVTYIGMKVWRNWSPNTWTEIVFENENSLACMWCCKKLLFFVTYKDDVYHLFVIWYLYFSWCVSSVCHLIFTFKILTFFWLKQTFYDFHKHGLIFFDLNKLSMIFIILNNILVFLNVHLFLKSIWFF